MGRGILMLFVALRPRHQTASNTSWPYTQDVSLSVEEEEEFYLPYLIQENKTHNKISMEDCRKASTRKILRKKTVNMHRVQNNVDNHKQARLFMSCYEST